MADPSLLRLDTADDIKREIHRLLQRAYRIGQKQARGKDIDNDVRALRNAEYIVGIPIERLEYGVDMLDLAYWEKWIYEMLHRARIHRPHNVPPEVLEIWDSAMAQFATECLGEGSPELQRFLDTAPPLSRRYVYPPWSVK